MTHDDLDPTVPAGAAPEPRWRWSRRQRPIVAALVAAILVSGLVLVRSLGEQPGGVDDLPVEVQAVGPPPTPPPPETTSLPPTTEAPPATTEASPATTEAPAPATSAAPAPPAPAPTAAPRRPLGSVLLMGDSVAASLAAGFEAYAAAAGIPFSSSTLSGCGLITGVTAFEDGTPVAGVEGCQDVIVEQQAGLAAREGASTVLAMSTWDTADRWVDGQFYRLGTPEGDALTLRLLAEAKDRILAGSEALLVVALQPSNAATSDLGPPPPGGDARMLHLHGLLRQFDAEHADVRLVDMAAIVCRGGPPCPAEVDGIRPRPVDGGHYSDQGAAWLAPLLFDALAAAVA